MHKQMFVGKWTRFLLAVMSAAIVLLPVAPPQVASAQGTTCDSSNMKTWTRGAPVFLATNNEVRKPKLLNVGDGSLSYTANEPNGKTHTGTLSWTPPPATVVTCQKITLTLNASSDKSGWAEVTGWWNIYISRRISGGGASSVDKPSNTYAFDFDPGSTSEPYIELSAGNDTVAEKWVLVQYKYTSSDTSIPPIIPTKCDWSGTWNTDFGATTAMTLVQSGNSVTGTYDWKGGQISGPVSGSMFSGTWSQSDSKGTFQFMISADCNSFSGNWASSSNSGSWYGTRGTGGGSGKLSARLECGNTLQVELPGAGNMGAAGFPCNVIVSNFASSGDVEVSFPTLGTGFFPTLPNGIVADIPPSDAPWNMTRPEHTFFVSYWACPQSPYCTTPAPLGTTVVPIVVTQNSDRVTLRLTIEVVGKSAGPLPCPKDFATIPVFSFVLGRAVDTVSQYDFGPDKISDGTFRLDVNTPTYGEIHSIAIEAVDENFRQNYGQVWETDITTGNGLNSWLLEVRDNTTGQRIDSFGRYGYAAVSPGSYLIRGTDTDTSGYTWFGHGQHFVVTVYFNATKTDRPSSFNTAGLCYIQQGAIIP